MIFAIDPGNEKSACVRILEDGSLRPFDARKVDNMELVDWLRSEVQKTDTVVIEMIASYGMGVGQTVFDTCVWIGRFWQQSAILGATVCTVKRNCVKLHICHDSRAKDGNIRQALADRFALGQANYGKGTKKNPGWFYGFSADMWQAYALGITWIETEGDSVGGKKENENWNGRAWKDSQH